MRNVFREIYSAILAFVALSSVLIGLGWLDWELEHWITDRIVFKTMAQVFILGAAYAVLYWRKAKTVTVIGFNAGLMYIFYLVSSDKKIGMVPVIIMFTYMILLHIEDLKRMYTKSTVGNDIPEKRTAWIVAEDELPEEGTLCAVANKDGGFYVAMYKVDGIWRELESQGRFVDYWMPLPELPKGE